MTRENDTAIRSAGSERALVHRALRVAAALAGLVAGVSFIPFLWCSRDGSTWYELPPDRAAALAATVSSFVEDPLTRDDFTTGSSQFDGEWLFGTYMMAGMGYGQLASLYPERREKCLASMRTCIERLLSQQVRAFDRESWGGSDPIESLDGPEGHAAYLGYLNLVLSYHRLHNPESEFANLNDSITEALVRRLGQSRIMLLETYPGECYPIDNCAAIASIALHARATQTDRTELLGKWKATFRERYMDNETGLMIQNVSAATGKAIDHPRGSGTALGIYFLSFMDAQLSADLYAALRTHLLRPVFGFGGVREYPAGVNGPSARGDIDSGPIVLGYGLSATGFALAGSRIHGDRDTFVRLYATAHAWGAPRRLGDRITFATGGPLGNAILFAMLTARSSPGPPAPDRQGRTRNTPPNGVRRPVALGRSEPGNTNRRPGGAPDGGRTRPPSGPPAPRPGHERGR